MSKQISQIRFFFFFAKSIALHRQIGELQNNTGESEKKILYFHPEKIGSLLQLYTQFCYEIKLSIQLTLFGTQSGKIY